MQPHNLTRLAVSCRAHHARHSATQPTFSVRLRVRSTPLSYAQPRDPYRSALPTPTHTPSAAPCVAVLVCALCGLAIGAILLRCLRFV